MKTVATLGLLAILAGLFLSERPDQPRFGLDHKNCVDPASPPLDWPPASLTFFVQPDQLFFRHSEEVNL